MRLWSLHPDLLDRVAMVAGWREGLSAQKVLRGLTTGYRHHPQLERFRSLADPVAGIATWLDALADDASKRGYRLDRTRIAVPPSADRLTSPRPHPMFDLVPGPVAAWEGATRPDGV